VLNSINVSLDSLLTSKHDTPLTALNKVSELFNAHKENLATFLTQDPQGASVIELINELASCWGREHKQDLKELQDITKNVALIKNIITTQQAVVKVGNLEQIVSIDELLEEALLISGIYSKQDITVQKDFGDISPIMIDHIKLFQVFNNIITNGKDALLESGKENKTLTIKTRLVNNKIVIEISDNGVGIPAADLKKIFNFGFTTKKTGHGFGLHASALTLNQLGGEISAKSDGVNKGATFIISIPHRRPTLF